MGCLRVHSNVLTGLSLAIYLARLERTGYDEEYFGPPEWEYEARYSVVWVKCATPAECKTIRIAVSTVKDSWVTSLGLRPHVYKPVCVFG